MAPDSLNNEVLIRKRAAMVEKQIRARGIAHPKILEAFNLVPRELFIPKAWQHRAYDDGPLPISKDQTISQPYIVALMVDALQLKGNETVLEVGCGSGYGAAILSRLCQKVFSIERIAALAERAGEVIKKLGYLNIQIEVGDGSVGLLKAAPFDAIVVTAGGPRIPPELEKQLRVGGRLVIPVGPYGQQRLLRVQRQSEDSFITDDLGAVCFVPLIGQEGWKDAYFTD